MLDIEAYKQDLIAREVGNNTIKNYLIALRQLNEFISRHAIGTITKEDTIAFKHHLQSRGYALSTLNQKIVILNIYFNWLHQPDLKVKTIKQQETVHRSSVNDKEYRRLLHFSNGEIHLFILTIANTGLRITEVCHLTRNDLDHTSIRIYNKGKYRVIAIPAFVKKKLKRFATNKTPSQRIFNKSQSLYREELKQVAAKANVNKDKVYPHSLRHYFAKQFIANGGDSTELQQMLGHSSISTTTIYTHLDNEELSRRFARIKNI